MACPRQLRASLLSAVSLCRPATWPKLWQPRFLLHLGRVGSLLFSNRRETREDLFQVELRTDLVRLCSPALRGRHTAHLPGSVGIAHVGYCFLSWNEHFEAWPCIYLACLHATLMWGWAPGGRSAAGGGGGLTEVQTEGPIP